VVDKLVKWAIKEHDGSEIAMINISRKKVCHHLRMTLDQTHHNFMHVPRFDNIGALENNLRPEL